MKLELRYRLGNHRCYFCSKRIWPWQKTDYLCGYVLKSIMYYIGHKNCVKNEALLNKNKYRYIWEVYGGK